MDFTPYIEALRRDLAAAGEAAAEEVRDAAQRLSYAVEPSLRLTLLEALSTAAAEVSAQLANAVVEVRLRGRDADLVVTDTDDAAMASSSTPPPTPPGAGESEEGTSRISLRLPDSLKSRVEQAAAREGLSVNAWLVRAISHTLDGHPGSASVRTGRRISGWVR